MPEEPRTQEPLLDFPRWRWEGEDADGILLWMLDATFQSYVTAWLETRGITHPTREQHEEALAHCRKLSYGKDCRDPEVHFVSDQHALERQRRARDAQ